MAQCVMGGDGQEHGPVFLMEPPPRLVFSNSTGSRVSCAAHGFPSPQISWQLPDGTQLDDAPGLRLGRLYLFLNNLHFIKLPRYAYRNERLSKH
ncbi:unnamed protein product [Pieris macdunnoughi]|uniref:Ig-like domain-containing protein n=1 Tax=Pieris macdunnoughi TaxID=345717 RepID=A0A821SPT9_9NEOP|nr:unnamed protein product [Pieris macdunnoughi]